MSAVADDRNLCNGVPAIIEDGCHSTKADNTKGGVSAAEADACCQLLSETSKANILIESEFHACRRRFNISGTLGQGAYGTVVSAQEKKNGAPVAIKRMENCLDRLSLAKRTLREIRIQRLLRHENILGFFEIFIIGEKEHFEDIFMVSELMETDLYLVLKSSQKLSESHCQFFLYQILRGCKYMHSAGVIHRDLKPKNLLVNSNCDLKICDFGWSRVKFGEVFPDQMKAMTEYVCTRWYRAPEVLCACTNYNSKVDMWSTGCIFAELLGRKTLFCGRNTESQLRLILETLGAPDEEDIDWVTNQKCRNWLVNQKALKGWGLPATVPLASEDAMDLLEKMLTFNPRHRACSVKCMEHTYLQELHCPEDEPSGELLDPADFQFEKLASVDEMREEMFLESLLYTQGNKEN